MKTSSQSLLLFVLLLVLPRVVSACGCFNTSTVLDDYEQADLVIIAKVKSVTKTITPTRFGGDKNHAIMTVQRVFKGDVTTGQELTFGQGDPTLGCSWALYENYVGEEYLLYLFRPEKPDEPFYISTCNRSTSVEGAHEDLLYLNNMDKLRGRTRVSGVIDQEGGEDEDVAGMQIRITGKNRSYVATTDKNGLYEVYDLPPGRYSVEPILRTGWEVDTYYLTRQPTRAELMRSDSDEPTLSKVWFTLRKKRHFGVSFDLRVNNKVSGIVTTADGKPLPRVCVLLIPEEPRFPYCRAFTNDDGSFVIKTVSAQKYYLILNPQNVTTSDQPFPKLYYPGVTNAADAKMFEVKFAQSIEGLKFVVPDNR